MTIGLFLEAEVPQNSQQDFESRYKRATGRSISPGDPPEYQFQPNKWGPELRVYFNDAGLAAVFTGEGIKVEFPRQGYKSGEFKYRINNNSAWWKLVEVSGLRLGAN
jgi:hypothetical protein